MCLGAQKYEHALFNAHLAEEKALKALYIDQHDEAPPYTHELDHIARTLSIPLTEVHMNLLREMSRLAVRVRYADHQWSSEQATAHNAQYWFTKAETLLSFLLPS